MQHLDIRSQGRRWEADELWRHDELPGRLELVRGQLCLDEDQRLLLLGALLEHVGTGRAVWLGPLQAWVDAVEARREDEAWDSMPAVGVEQFWRASTQRLPFSQLLALKRDLSAWRRTRRHAKSSRPTRRSR